MAVLCPNVVAGNTGRSQLCLCGYCKVWCQHCKNKSTRTPGSQGEKFIRSLHLLCTDAVCFQLKNAGESHAYATFELPLYLPLSIHHASMCVKITKAANEQECSQISETARRLSQQGAAPTPWLLSTTHGALKDKGMPGFSRHGMCRSTEKWLEEWKERREKNKKIDLQFFCVWYSEMAAIFLAWCAQSSYSFKINEADKRSRGRLTWVTAWEHCVCDHVIVGEEASRDQSGGWEQKEIESSPLGHWHQANNEGLGDARWKRSYNELKTMGDIQRISRLNCQKHIKYVPGVRLF